MYSLLRGILDCLQFCLLLVQFVWVHLTFFTILLYILAESILAVLLLDLLLKVLLLSEVPGFDLAHAFVRDCLHVSLALLHLLQILPRLHSIGRNPCIHLGEEEAKDALSVFPLQVIQIDLVREWLLASIG